MTLPISHYVYGIATSGGSPVDACPVKAISETTEQGTASTTTNADGKYTIDMKSYANDSDTIRVWANKNGEHAQNTYTLVVAHRAKRMDFAIAGKILTESIGIVDSITKQASLIKSDIIGLLDTVERQPKIILSDQIGLLDTFIGQAHKILVDYVGILDLTVEKEAKKGKTLTEIIGLTDMMLKSISKVFTESIGIVDSLIKQPKLTIEEKIGLVDSVTKILNELEAYIQSYYSSQYKESDNIQEHEDSGYVEEHKDSDESEVME